MTKQNWPVQQQYKCVLISLVISLDSSDAKEKKVQTKLFSILFVSRISCFQLLYSLFKIGSRVMWWNISKNGLSYQIDKSICLVGTKVLVIAKLEIDKINKIANLVVFMVELGLPTV